MKIRIFIVFVCLLSISSLNAQNNMSFEKSFDDAEKVFSNVYHNGEREALTYSKGGYAVALPLFINLFGQDTADMSVAFKIGVCYLSSRQERARAITFFNKAVRAASANYNESSYKEKNAPLIAYKFLGDAYHLNNQFDKAIAAYEKYIAIMAQDKSTNKILLDETKRSIEMCKT